MISGTTNVNQFRCRYQLKEFEIPVRMNPENRNGRIVFHNARLKLANDCFDCGGKGINADFREILQTERHPHVELTLLYVDSKNQAEDRIAVGLEIKIAGEARKYETYLNCDNRSEICVQGHLALKLSDFGLDPPKKVFGMIKVNDEIAVDFALVMKQL